jgi:hypothetical protein
MQNFDMEYLVLPINDGGITYVRNFIKEYSEASNMDSYWQLDDDISGFFYREGTKLIRCGFEALINSQNVFENNSIALGALEYRQFAWSANKEIILNSFCDSCVFVDNKKTKGMRYNKYLEGKEDRDFAMQTINNGMKTARTTMFAFSAPANGSNLGGLKEIFYDKKGLEERVVDRMIEVWGNKVCNKIVKKDGRIDCKINWNKINCKQKELF